MSLYGYLVRKEVQFSWITKGNSILAGTCIVDDTRQPGHQRIRQHLHQRGVGSAADQDRIPACSADGSARVRVQVVGERVGVERTQLDSSGRHSCSERGCTAGHYKSVSGPIGVVDSSDRRTPGRVGNLV